METGMNETKYRCRNANTMPVNADSGIKISVSIEERIGIV